MKRELRRSTIEGEGGSIEVQGAESTEYVSSEAKPRRSAAKRNEDQDELEEDEEEDDEDPGEEDGVSARRLGRKEEMTSYGDMDDDDRAVATASLFEDDVSDGEEEKDTSQIQTTPSTPSSYTKMFGSFDSGNTVEIDEENNSLVIAPLRVDPSSRPLLMVGLVERAAAVTLVRSRPKIQQAFINEEDNGRGRCLQTAGVNFEELWKLPPNIVDHNRLVSNDIWAVRCAYGVEAARLNIVEQIRSVFGAYGISVDPRHLSLIADYMTYDGGFKAMNRTGMADASSPFLQMSFETTANFMMDAVLRSQKEHLVSPSANIVMGRPIRHGTGAFDLLAK
jgi:DNA-directed RNA polymerase I subunit RPA1